jgi:hypothetical protein
MTGQVSVRFLCGALAVCCLVGANQDQTNTAITQGVQILLERQEGPNAAEWPYQGVYRVRGRIPIGYRVGGTSLCATALLRAPGYDQDLDRQAAIHRATAFIAASVDHPLMSIDDYDGGYDVRCWGYIYGLTFLLELEASQRVPDDLKLQVANAIAFYLDGIQRLEITKVGGWNYARRGRQEVARAAPFMTAPALQALFQAKAQGYDVDDAVIERGLDSLAKGRTPMGAFAYSGPARPGKPDAVPGATGRMVVGESTLHLAGRADVARVRGAIDAFLVHWDQLEKRRAKNGTHEPPYGVAPYYFFFAHYYAGQAIELLPEAERQVYRDRLAQLLFQVQNDDGSWNDRVFDRSANYGTALSMMILNMPAAPMPARWHHPSD